MVWVHQARQGIFPTSEEAVNLKLHTEPSVFWTRHQALDRRGRSCCSVPKLLHCGPSQILILLPLFLLLCPCSCTVNTAACQHHTYSLTYHDAPTLLVFVDTNAHLLRNSSPSLILPMGLSKPGHLSIPRSVPSLNYATSILNFTGFF